MYSEDYNLDSRYWEYDPESTEAHTARYFDMADSFEDRDDTPDPSSPRPDEQ